MSFVFMLTELLHLSLCCDSSIFSSIGSGVAIKCEQHHTKIAKNAVFAEIMLALTKEKAASTKQPFRVTSF